MSRVLTLSSYSPQDYPKCIHFDRRVTSCFMKMFLLVFEESADGHTNISALTQFGILVCHFLGNIRRHFEDMWNLGVCDFFNCLKNVKTCMKPSILGMISTKKQQFLTFYWQQYIFLSCAQINIF